MSSLASLFRALLLAAFVFITLGAESFCADHDHGHEAPASAGQQLDCACLCHAPNVPHVRLVAPPQAITLPCPIFAPADQMVLGDGFRSRIFQPPRSFLA